MKSITLHTAALDNSGIRHDGGATVDVGKADHQISADRAAELVATGLASAAPAKGGDAPADAAEA